MAAFASLRWQAPREVTDYQVDGRDDALLVAPGWAGLYAIERTGKDFLLWWAHDGYQWKDGFETLYHAQAAAEEDWQARMAALVRVPHSPAEPYGPGVKDGLAIIESRVGKAPCAECHLRAGETCDICGAAAPDAQPALPVIRAERSTTP